MPMEIPWPKSDTRLLLNQTATDIDSANAAFQISPSWGSYRAAFEEAVRSLQAKASRDTDYMIFPLWFCGRHAVELGLKELTAVLSAYLEHFGAAVPEDVGQLEVNHGLVERWNAIEVMMAVAVDLGAHRDDGQVHFARLVDELEAVDKTSMRFRYPTTKGSKKKDPEPQFGPGAGDLPEVVSVAQLVDGCEAMFGYLTGCIDYFEVAIQNSEPQN